MFSIEYQVVVEQCLLLCYNIQKFECSQCCNGPYFFNCQEELNSCLFFSYLVLSVLIISINIFQTIFCRIAEESEQNNKDGVGGGDRDIKSQL